MPRPERPLDTGDEPLPLFARELRKLRESAGNPPYRRLAREAHYSVTTLSDAAGGKTLPSLAVTLAYVRACGGDPAAWERRWRETKTLLTPADTADPGDLRPPYLGLSAFGTGDADRFFGRGALLGTLLDRVRHHRLVAVLGASGSGKSSLLHAGLAGTGARPAVTFTPGASPIEECALHLAAFAGESASALHRELTDDPTAVHLHIRQALAGHPAGTELLLVIDQFEELFTLCTDVAQRQAFITALTHAATAPRSQARVVLGVRSDFFAHCARHPGLQPALGPGQVLVGPMSPGELREAIVKPAAAAHYTVESELVARLVAEAADQPGALPLISHALLETWHRRQGMALTVAGYEQAGGIRHALARTAEHVYVGFDEPQQAMARQILVRLTALGEGTEDTKRRIARTELDDTATVRAVLGALTAARLVTVDHDTVEVTHEALIKHWPRLREWLASDREALRLHRQLSGDAAVWESLHRDPDALYRGSRLARTRELADTALTERERTFLDAGLAAESAQQTASRRRSRLLRVLVVLLAALLGATTVATVAALRANDLVTAQRDTVLAQQVAEEAVTLRAGKPALAAQLALAAYRLRPTPRNRDALVSAVAVPLGHPQEVDAAAFSPDGRLLATASADHRVRLWNIADPAHPALLVAITGHSDAVHAVGFDPGGKVLATAGRDRTVRLWDLRDAAHPAPLALLTGHRDSIYSLAYAPDGRTLATAGYDHTVRLWDVRVPARPVGLPTLTTHTKNVKAVAFSPDSRLLASGGDDRTVRLWDVGDPARPVERAVLTGHTDLVVTVAFSRDGRIIASGGDDRTVRLWTVTGPARPAVLTGHTDVVSSLAFSPDRQLLASASYDHSVRLWDITRPTPASSATLTGHTGAVEWATYSRDGRLLATAGDDHTALLWETDPGRAAARACEIARPAITRQEWDTYFPGVGYQPPC
ncbi:XRE family transcriptional regulator [Amycolatopsis sp. NPDC049688]|uniref:nSTAND1 domain-containing NTPase n=1 Tax=Amycolatopsis sp. NPDC049688 TaxID=3154733 RepID=UPI003420123D